MSLDRTVPLYPLTYVPEGEDVAVGRFGTDHFAIFPADGAALLKKLESGMTLSAAADWYEQTYNDVADLEDFLDTLRELQFIREDQTEKMTEQVRWQKLGKALFSPVAWFLYTLLFACCLYDLIRIPALRPQASHVFFTPYLLVMEIVLFFGQYPGVLFHEAFHLLAARRLGLPSRLGFGRRMYYFVLESSMPGIKGVPIRKRYLPFLAGMVADVVWFSMLTVAARFLLQATGSGQFIGAVFLGLSFTTVLRFLWQFYFYLQTDIYFVISTILGCSNLQQTTREHLRNIWWRFRGRMDRLVDESTWTERDRQVARWYVYVFAAGRLWSIGVLILFMLPVLLRILNHVYTQLSSGSVGISFWDSVLFLILNISQYLFVLYIYLRERRSRKQQRTATNVSYPQEG